MGTRASRVPLRASQRAAEPFRLVAAFDGAIDRRHTCDGPGVAPPLQWTRPPPGTTSLALLVTDLDAGGFAHWVVYDVPADARDLSGGREGVNDFGHMGYGGPCPPSGRHRYRFSLYALDRPTGLPAGADAREVRRAVDRRTLARADLVAAYAR
jgi:Raf kinase inhibitor-like YbhB/YbcL family protein